MEFVTDMGSGSSWFKPAEYASAKALLIEPKHYQPDAVDPFNEGATRNILTADVTAFVSAGMLDGSESPVVITGTNITASILARDLSGYINKACIFRIEKAGRAWVFRPVDPAISEQVIAYAEKRDAAPADDDPMPDFTKMAQKPPF